MGRTAKAMQFLLIAYDGTDAEAPARRQRARVAHLENVRRMKAEGSFIEGGAILNDAGEMIGSMLLLEFPGMAELNDWLKSDPYTVGKVWESVEVKPFRRAPV